MFDKLIGGKKRKEEDLFSLPEKRYTTDIKIISKLGAKALLELHHEQEKYIASVAEKMAQVRQQYDRLVDKNDELAEKNDVVNSQISRMTNEHEELTIKFDNLQASLQMFSSENESIVRKEVQFLKENQAPIDKIKSISTLLAFYRQKFSLCKKIELQNKQLKAKYAQLEEELEQSEAKIKAFEQDKNYNNLIPSLLKEIQELKAAKPQNNHPTGSEEVQKLEQKILMKVKSQIETASTVRSSEEEQQLVHKQAEIERLGSQLGKERKKVSSLQTQYEEYATIVNQYEERLNALQGEVARLQQQNQSLQRDKEEIKKKCIELQKQYHEQSQQIQNEASEETAGLLTELEEAREKGKAQDERLAHIEKQLHQARVTISELTQSQEATTAQLICKTEQLTREKSNRLALENTLSSKNSSQLEHLLQLKNTLEKELSEVRQIAEAQRKSVAQLNGKVKRLGEQNEGLKNSVKRLGEEKSIIQENVSNCLKIAEDEGEKYKSEIKALKKSNEDAKRQNEGLKVKVKDIQEQLKNYSAETEKLFRTVQTKDNELRKSYASCEQLEKEKAGLIQQIIEREEQEKSRARRYEAELNQERIKLESVNRKLTILQNKGEENKTSMDGMYEQLLAKDKKISQMEIKLKEYKYRIQLLRKEKQEIENTYENKLSNLQPEEQGLKLNQTQEEEKPNDSKEQEADEEKTLLQNELYSTREQNKVIRAQNESLRDQIQELKLQIADKEKSIKMLQEKRDNMMREIQKIGRKNTPAEPMSAMLPMLSPKESTGEGREKKIASKALKGFDIVLKLEHQLYKNFVSVFAQQMEQEKIKGLQRQINAVIKKSSDMKDVFEGYLQ